MTGPSSVPSGVPSYAAVEKGDELPAVTVRLRRADLVRYAGASGDFNPIHWSDRAAQAVGLPGVIAHGMLTMAHAGRVLTDWVVDPSRVEEYSVRFSRTVDVPDDDEGAELLCAGTVADKLDGDRVRIDLTATSGDDKVLTAARAVVRLDP